jgi:hypothetical protein
VLAHTDVLVLPSRYEELGSVLLETIRAGVPIVASDTGGIPRWCATARTACSARRAIPPLRGGHRRAPGRREPAPAHG